MASRAEPLKGATAAASAAASAASAAAGVGLGPEGPEPLDLGLGGASEGPEGSPEGSEEGARSVDVQINRLRQKIEDDPSNPVYLQTVRGAGYVLHAD